MRNRMNENGGTHVDMPDKKQNLHGKTDYYVIPWTYVEATSIYGN